MVVYLEAIEQIKCMGCKKIRERELEMDDIHKLEKLKGKIEDKRQELNNLITQDIDKEKILQFSMELDELIFEYHNLEIEEDEKRADN